MKQLIGGLKALTEIVEVTGKELIKDRPTNREEAEAMARLMEQIHNLYGPVEDILLLLNKHQELVMLKEEQAQLTSVLRESGFYSFDYQPINIKTNLKTWQQPQPSRHQKPQNKQVLSSIMKLISILRQRPKKL